MRINALTQPIQSELRKVENARRTEKNGTVKGIPTDRPEISAAGTQQLNSDKASVESIAAVLSTAGDIRTDRISEVQEKIKNGYYDSPEFIDKLAVKLLSEFGIKDPAQK
jgi:anti-sigma28 factor (negative regulator of flagellin synthesis)